MTTTVQAVYEEDDLLRLLSPLALKKGDQVEVTVHTTTLAELERAAPDPSRVAEIMADIAALAVPRGEPDFGGRDHDQILYGSNGAR